MSLRDTITDALRRSRARNTVIASGACASVALGGVAVAAAPMDMFASDNASQHQAATQSEATEQKDETKQESPKQQKDAEQAEKKQARAEKKADDSRDEKKTSRDGQRSWVQPVSKPYTLTADFGNSGDRWSNGHSGQDFGVGIGTPVKAVHSGTVVKANWGSAFGNHIVIEHPNGKSSQYAHLSKINVSPGEHVNTGTKIGLSGNTGNSTGPHLHFEIRNTPVFGTAIDPVPFMKNHGAKL